MARKSTTVEEKKELELSEKFLAAPYLVETYKTANSYMRTPIKVAFVANAGALLAIMASGQGGVLQRLAENAGLAPPTASISIAVICFLTGIFLALFASLKSYIVLRKHISFVLEQKGKVEYVPVSGLARAVMFVTILSILAFTTGTVIILNLFGISGNF